MQDANAMRWDGRPGHYEVWYATLTDPRTATGLWIRYTLHAPLVAGEHAECALWLAAMTPGGEGYARRATFPAGELEARADPFRICLAGADLSDRGAAGAVDDGAWELSWVPRLPAVGLVHPLVQRTRIAETELVLSHPDLAISGTVRLGERTLALDGARGAQAHLWGTRHAGRWTWAHCNDFRAADGAPRPDTFLDGVSVDVERLGRKLGPSTPVVGRFRGADFAATDPVSLVRARSRFGLTTWRFEARDGKRRIVGAVDAPRDGLVGVTYRDPDGRPAYCYNSEVASMHLWVWDRTARGRFGWTLRDTLIADRRAHFEYGQRASVPGVALLLP